MLSIYLQLSAAADRPLVANDNGGCAVAAQSGTIALLECVHAWGMQPQSIDGAMNVSGGDRLRPKPRNPG